jgi:hypothetical protein
MQGKWWGIDAVMFLIIPYLFVIVGIPGLMVLPYYYINKYIQKKLQPRQSGKKLLLYFLVSILFTFAYMSAGIYLVVWVAKALK